MPKKTRLNPCPKCSGQVKMIRNRLRGWGDSFTSFCDIRCKQCGRIFLTHETITRDATRYWNANSEHLEAKNE